MKHSLCQIFVFHTSYVGKGNYILISTFLEEREGRKMRGWREVFEGEESAEEGGNEMDCRQCLGNEEI